MDEIKKRKGGRKPGKVRKTVSFTLPEGTKRLIDTWAQALGLSKARFIDLAVSEYDANHPPEGLC